jgi:hypothetical protein
MLGAVLVVVVTCEGQATAKYLDLHSIDQISSALRLSSNNLAIDSEGRRRCSRMVLTAQCMTGGQIFCFDHRNVVKTGSGKVPTQGFRVQSSASVL